MSTKKIFNLPYIGIDKHSGITVLYSSNGDHSVIFKIKNIVLEYAADPDLYYEYHRIFNNIIEVLGADYSIHKHDIFSKQEYHPKQGVDFLDQKYFEHFRGREYQKILTYVTITRKVKRSQFFVYDEKDFRQFLRNITKINSIFQSRGFSPVVLEEKEVNDLIARFLIFDFSNQSYSLSNIKAGDECLEIGNKAIKSMSLIDIDEINMPESLKPLGNINIGFDFPVDLFSFLKHIPTVDTVVYTQIISIPNQREELKKLEGKKRKHISMPDPANNLAVEDIDNVFSEIARNNKILVYGHFNIMFCADRADLDLASNYIEGALMNAGIKPSNNAYNQFELFNACMPGSSSELKIYDQFLTTSDAALCLLFKESLTEDEPSDFQINFASRQGIPIAIDLADLPMSQNRINNRNKFVLGPSGSGKSFFMNHIVRQYVKEDYHLILVDVGHSYSGICSYFGGTYITHSDEVQITANPFLFSREEYNEEKREFLKALIFVAWKKADGIITPVEDSILSIVIKSYYEEFFQGSFSELSFDSFYNYSIPAIRKIIQENNLDFKINEYSFILEQFTYNGQYGQILNKRMDSSLFDIPFIVFEIDAIKDNKSLFPIITLIIMDVFIQKMRLKSNRKALIIEEAWKAIASPVMASYILYLYKTVRKFRGEAIVVTQEIGDLIGNSIVKDSIVNNSDTICLLDQSKFKENFDDIANLLSITQVERKKIFTVNALENKSNRGRFKEVYIKRGSSGEVYGVEVSIYEYLTFTTERTEKEAVRVYTDKAGNYEKGLTNFVADFINSKISLTDFSNRVLSSQYIFQS
jgi:conjugation system TraG family ATPase